MKTLLIKTDSRNHLVDITHEIDKYIQEEKIKDGFIFIHVPHTTAGITVNENADPDVKNDIIKGLRRYDNEHYNHMEGNSPAHIKSSLMGCNLTLKVHNGNLVLGTWQGIMFCEFDGPRNRKVFVDRF